MHQRLEGSKHAGVFRVENDREVYGELSVDGLGTALQLRDGEYFGVRGETYILGTLHDFRKVTLVDCVVMTGTGTTTVGEQRSYHSTIYPHFVLTGMQHVAPTAPAITQTHFVIDDAPALFPDYDAFGSVLDAGALIDAVAAANGRRVTTGKDAAIVYFAGKLQIVGGDTAVAQVEVMHRPNASFMGSPAGVHIGNTIWVTLTFADPVPFHDAIHRTTIILRFMELVAGRKQNLERLTVTVGGESAERQRDLEVYWTAYPKRSATNDQRAPHPADILLNAIHDPSEFVAVLKNWVASQPARADARSRFFDSFLAERYGVDRLIRSANMFDILPSEAIPPDTALSAEAQVVRERCRALLLELPQSLERDGVLGALGRMGKSSLKRRIRFRASKVIEAMQPLMSELTTITDEAVMCRNHYVHGSEGSFDYSANGSAVMFFSDTLEFVFAASEFVEHGWNARAWLERGGTASHPFSNYVVTYRENLRHLQGLLAQQAAP